MRLLPLTSLTGIHATWNSWQLHGRSEAGKPRGQNETIGIDCDLSEHSAMWRPTLSTAVVMLLSPLPPESGP
ncbi:hypothetical protein lerEdw1_006116 [Lerista edwardsae]|nr:hypothetical protein lerEdw1_006116 [Lerista edwardsae]